MRNQIHDYLLGLLQLRKLCDNGHIIAQYADAIKDACAVASKLGLWFASDAYTREVESYRAWRREAAPDDTMIQCSYLSVMERVIAENYDCGCFEVVPPHKDYWLHLATVAKARAERDRCDEEAAIRSILDNPLARAAIDNPLYSTIDVFRDERAMNESPAEQG